MRLGRYEVQDVLGRGGMGVVFRARSPEGGEVALKLLTRSDEVAGARFAREVRLLASLGSDDGFVPFLDAGFVPEGTFLVMPLLTGGTLRSRLEGGRLPVEETRALGIALATALGHAHAKGIVHRDVKPENVIYEVPGGRPLLADLGIAKHFDREVAGGSRSASVSLAAGPRGTAGYMAPEQVADAREAGPPADVFALGATLHECLAGEPAFSGDTLVDVVARVMDTDPPRLDRVRPDVPRWLAGTIAQALAKAPGARFPDGHALARALREGHGRRRSRVPWLVGAALACSAAVAAVRLSRHEMPRELAPPKSLPVAPAAPAAPAGPTIAELEAAVERLDDVETTTPGSYASGYVRLAEAYRAAGRKVEARAALDHALRVDSWNFEGQRQILDLDLELGSREEAYRRAEFLVRTLAGRPGADALVSHARDVVDRLVRQGVHPPARPALSDRTLLVFGFAGADPVLVSAVASRIGFEFGLLVETLEERPEPTTVAQHPPLRDPYAPTTEPLLDCDALTQQATQVAGARLERPGVVGVLGITRRDMTSPPLVFLFGSGEPGRGVFSYARFRDPRPDVLRKRAVMQAFSTTMRILGLPRCSTPSCATARPNNLDEHDRKVDELCPECLAKLATLAR